MPEASNSNSQRTVEIRVDADVLGALCRRGRRRLRDIQSATSTILKLDRYRGTLHVVGSAGAIADVRKQLDGLTGPTVVVTAAVWAELMRTRTSCDPCEAAVARIQQQSGCRIHVERGEPKARIFGPKNKTCIAERLLQELDSMCVEVSVSVTSAEYLQLDVLQTFAEEFGVTLNVEENQITVLGLAGAVIEAAKEIQNSNSDQTQLSLVSGGPSEIARSTIRSCLLDLVGDGDVTDVPQDLGDAPQESGNGFLQGAVLSKLPSTTVKPSRQVATPPRQQCSTYDSLPSYTDTQVDSADGSTCGSGGSFCSNCGKNIGMVNFCVYCGQPTDNGRMRNAQTRDFSDGCFDKMQTYIQQPMQFMSPNMCSSGAPPMVMAHGMQTTSPMMSLPMSMGYPMGPSSPSNGAIPGITNGLQLTNAVMVNQANGMQSYMVPMTFGSFE